MGILDELFRRKPEDEFLPEYARPADPLRALKDWLPDENKDLPKPRFFADPQSLSLVNMLRSAIDTSANWLDATKDPSLVGPQEMVSPFGLGVVGSMGTGVKNAMTRPSRDHSISEALGRQYPNEVAGGEMREVGRKIVVDNGKRQSWAEDPHLERAWNAAGGQLRQRNQGRKHFIEPANVNTPGPYSVMADNAKGSAPGTVINSLDPGSSAFHEKVQRRSSYLDAKLQRAEEKKAAWAERRGTSPTPAKPTEPDSIGGHLMMVPRGIAVNDGTAGWRVTDMPSVQNARNGILPADHLGVKFPGAGRPANDILADNAKGSAPGLAANSTQQTMDASQLSEPMLMELLRKLEEGA